MPTHAIERPSKPSTMAETRGSVGPIGSSVNPDVFIRDIVVNLHGGGENMIPPRDRGRAPGKPSYTAAAGDRKVRTAR